MPQLGTDLSAARAWTNEYQHNQDADANAPDVTMINGRPATDWEQDAKRRAVLAARKDAAALVAMPRRNRR